MIDAAALLKLNTLGLTGEQYAGVLEVLAAATANADMSADIVADRRDRDRERKRLARALAKIGGADKGADMSADNTPASSPSPALPPQKEKSPPAPPLKKNTPPSETPTLFSTPESARGASVAGEGFERFWDLFPNKVGKADARKAFDKAARKIDLGPMLEALERYTRKTDDRPWCNPATWLNQERWGDMPAQVARGSPPGRVSKVEQTGQNLRNRIDELQRRRGEGGEGGGDVRPAGRLLAIERKT